MLDACEKREVQQNLVSPATIGVGWQRLSFAKTRSPLVSTTWETGCNIVDSTRLQQLIPNLSCRSPVGVGLQLLYLGIFVNYASERFQQRDVRMPLGFGTF